MTRSAKKAIEKYNMWVEEGMIYSACEDDEYDNSMLYESVNGDSIGIERDADGNILDAWEN